MRQVDPEKPSGPAAPRGRPTPGRLWVPLVLLVGLLLLGAILTLCESLRDLFYVVTRATLLDSWAVLQLLSATFSCVAIAGAVFQIRQRKPLFAIAFAMLSVPTPFVLEGSRCDTAEACRAMGWAALPAAVLRWNVRIRPVTTPNEAEDLASSALAKAGSPDSPFKTLRRGDDWIVSTINSDGWPGAHAVQIERRSGQATFVPCPGSQMQCGMERPIVSDGRRVFRNDRAGVSAAFPAGRVVCTSRAKDDVPIGFYAMVRSPDQPCEILDNSRQIGIEIAQSQKRGCASLADLSLAWRPLTPATASMFQQSPRMGDAQSLACELHRGDDIQISVYARAAPQNASKPRPNLLYEAYIVTDRAHLSEDVRAFEVFLRNVTIADAAMTKPS